jgi:two-component system phosphate regulon response regulator PhoB
MGQKDKSGLLACAGVQLDLASGSVTSAGRPVLLTATERRLLALFLAEPGRVFSRAELLEGKVAGDALVLERTIDVHVCDLRRKLGNPALIETVRRQGYRFREPSPG